MEVEAKYTVPDRPTFKRLLALTALGGYALGPVTPLALVDHYLDTAGRDLWRAGYALRLRDAGDHWRGTLKSLGGGQGALHQREEHELDVPPGALPADWPPGPARDLALRLSAGRPLAELFTLRQRRAPRLVWRGAPGDGQPVAELALDRVRWSHAAQALELELELKPGGGPDDLATLQAALAEFALTPQPQSKFERGLALLSAAAPRPKAPPVRADEPMAEVGRHLLLFHFERMRAQEAGARAGEDIEAVHAMRVAVRRQRAALLLFADYFKPKALRPLRRGLKAVADSLGAVRDLDVQLVAARAYQAGLPSARAQAFAAVPAAWEAERTTARAALLAHLDGRAFRQFQKRAAKFLATPGAGVARAADPAAPTLVRDVLPARLWAHYGAVRAYAPLLPGGEIETLHALRIAGKRLRYALEFFAGALGPAGAPAIAAVVALQDHLGELNDAAVTLDRLERLQRARPRPAAATARAILSYQRAQQVRLRRLHRTAGRPIKAVLARAFRRLLGLAVAHL